MRRTFSILGVILLLLASGGCKKEASPADDPGVPGMPAAAGGTPAAPGTAPIGTRAQPGGAIEK